MTNLLSPLFDRTRLSAGDLPTAIAPAETLSDRLAWHFEMERAQSQEWFKGNNSPPRDPQAQPSRPFEGIDGSGRAVPSTRSHSEAAFVRAGLFAPGSLRVVHLPPTIEAREVPAGPAVSVAGVAEPECAAPGSSSDLPPAALLSSTTPLAAGYGPQWRATALPDWMGLRGDDHGEHSGRVLSAQNIKSFETEHGECVSLHIEWSGETANIWIGLNARLTEQAMPAITQSISRWLSSQGLRLRSLVCNGQAQPGDVSHSLVAQADAPRSLIEVLAEKGN